MARTDRATEILRDENILAQLLSIVWAVEVLAELYDDPRDLERLARILADTEDLRGEARDRRNPSPHRREP